MKEYILIHSLPAPGMTGVVVLAESATDVPPHSVSMVFTAETDEAAQLYADEIKAGSNGAYRVFPTGKTLAEPKTAKAKDA